MWIPNIGAIFKALIMVVLGVAVLSHYAAKMALRMNLSIGNILPSWDAGLFFCVDCL
jgi:hypothetical protein